MRRHLEDDVLGPSEAHDGSAHVVGVALVVVMRVSGRQIHRNVVSVVHLEFDAGGAQGGLILILKRFLKSKPKALNSPCPLSPEWPGQSG